MQYLEAVQAAGTDDADAVVKQLEGKKVNDFFLRNGEFRAADHRVVHDAYLAKVKPGSEVKEPWDYEQILKTIPAAGGVPRPVGRLQAVVRWVSCTSTFNGLVGGSFYALLALGLAVIFGMLRVVNFAHGAFYMLGAFGAYVLLAEAGICFWWALLVVPVVLGLLGHPAGTHADPPAVHAGPAVQLPAHLRADADAAGPGEVALRLAVQPLRRAVGAAAARSTSGCSTSRPTGSSSSASPCCSASACGGC